MQWEIIGSGFVGTALQTHMRKTGDRVDGRSAPRLTAPIGSDALALARLALEHPVATQLAADPAEVTSTVLCWPPG